MEWDDELCLCFHVSPRKVWNYLRLHRPQRASQLSECQGAGTGCGWCRRYLASMFDRWAVDRANQLVSELPADELQRLRFPGSSQYAADRASYVRSGGGVPAPGATPLPPEEGS